MPDSQVCETCNWWINEKQETDGTIPFQMARHHKPIRVGECHGAPPSVGAHDARNYNYVFPTTPPTQSCGAWKPVEVDGVLGVSIDGGHGARGFVPLTDPLSKDECGPRIPDNDTLVAMQEMAEHCPVADWESLGNVCAVCFCTHQAAPSVMRGDAIDLEVWHDADCPWLRSQAKKSPDSP